VASYRYYYFIPQLPNLIFGQGAPVSSKDFIQKASALIDACDAEILAQLSLSPFAEGEGSSKEVSAKKTSVKKVSCDFLRGFVEWDKALRLNLARLRALKLGRTPDPAPAVPESAVTAALRAFESANPLEGEEIIDRARWDAVEVLQGAELFHRRTVFAHLMKLFILERQASFQAELGFSQYKSLYDSILDRYLAETKNAELDGSVAMGESE
jgi:hypothetical protein